MAFFTKKLRLFLWVSQDQIFRTPSFHNFYKGLVASHRIGVNWLDLAIKCNEFCRDIVMRVFGGDLEVF